MERDNIGEIRNFVDSIDKKEDAGVKRKWHTKKLFGLPLGMIVLTVSGLLVMGILISGFTWFTAVIENDIETVGVEGSLFYIDDELVNLQSGFDMGDDVTSLSAGDNITVSHKFYSDPQDGNWSLYFNKSAMSYFMNDPDHKYYGFYFYTNATSDTITVMAGDTVYVDFYYVLDPQFQQLPQEDAIPFDLSVDAVKI